MSVKTQAFFLKTELRHISIQLLVNHSILFCWYIFMKSLTHEKVNRIGIFLTWNWQLIWDWHGIKQENMIHIYAVTVTDVTGVQ